MRVLISGQRGFSQFLKRFSRRGETEYAKVEMQVRNIVEQVKKQGDPALIGLTQKYDGWNVSPKTLRVSRVEFRAALKILTREEKKTLEFAAARIERFHALQDRRSWSFAEEDGTVLGQIVQPVDRVGIYVPGGKAAYPSSVLMNAIPARVAGVPYILMASPAPKGYVNPAVLVASQIAGVNAVFKVGGAQAIAAMAFGTKTIPRVDKIVGPGNIYVASAKRMVFGDVSIDSIAGPSEILIIGDQSADPAFLAADLISQAEHDEQAAAALICFSKSLGGKVQKEISRQLAPLPRRDIAERSLKDYGAILIVKNLSEAVKIVNALAPEHLELAVADPFRLLKKIENAGAIFLGHISPEAIGDYVAGPNHVLPTGGTARFSSPLGVYDFLKRSSLICLSPEGFKKLADPGMQLARMENLEAHLRAIAVRKKSIDSSRL
ncbi:MAG: histidinol dehydrogenase [Deltaproteobacteria bacterium]|nr:histidinol dehydrogenase [Deltaproteobacteria bacterium]